MNNIIYVVMNEGVRDWSDPWPVAWFLTEAAAKAYATKLAVQNRSKGDTYDVIGVEQGPPEV